MRERQQLLKNLQAAHFALIEANLFLDTHPSDKDALAFYEKMQKQYKEWMEEFTEKFGALSSLNVKTQGDYFEWVNNPWPWELEA